MTYDEVPEKKEIATGEMDPLPSSEEESHYTYLPSQESRLDELKGIGGLAARKAALFGR